MLVTHLKCGETKCCVTQTQMYKVAYLSCVDNAHVHASLAGMVQEGTVEAPPHCLIASEGEGNVGDTPADFAPWALPLDLPGGANEVNSVVVVL